MDVLELFTDQNVLFAVKLAFLIVFGLYIVFAFVIVKQVDKMTETLEVGFETPVRFIAYTHLLLSIGMFLVALAIL